MPFTISMIESDLIDACLANDRLAQKKLYEKYKNAMYSVCYRITNDYDMANDVLQDAFIQIFKSLASFRRESTLGAWIKTIVVRTAIKKIKKTKKFVELDDRITSGDDFIDWGHYLDAEYLEKAILSLPGGYRSVFVLIEVEGYSHKEVGKMLGISEGTSKSQLFHAKKKLRVKLEKMI